MVTGFLKDEKHRDFGPSFAQEQLVKKGVISPRGRGRGAHYEFLKKRRSNGSNGSSKPGMINGS